MTTPTALAETYFTAWKNRDFDALRAVLADDVTFVGALGTATGADECIVGLQGMSQILTDIVVRVRVSEGDDVITWFDLHTNTGAPPAPTANWQHVVAGRIAAINVAFDPRAILGISG